MKIDRKSRPVARRVQKRGQLKKAHYTSAGGAHVMQLESRLEASAAIAMGLDPRVRSIRSQPMTFDLATGRTYPSVEALQAAQKLYGFRPIKYTPDFEVDLGGPKVLIEVKHRKLITLNPKILSYPSALARYGYRLAIFDDHILDENFVRNMRLLNIAKSTRALGDDTEALTTFCGSLVPYAHLLAAGFSEATVLTAIAYGKLTCDVRSSRLNHDTLLSSEGDTSAHLKELPLVCY
ncbi:hypothetical protein [Roseovarius aestuariivivens]|uniref:hypothetical protein n=1 Tax=Roseovarius aestuariivivens TaxID=1888910 RepID=UPI0010809AAB|nr:hypothetical protein [Roseovarius aestuariivivens]